MPALIRCSICGSARLKEEFCMDCGHILRSSNANGLDSGTILAGRYIVGRALGAFYHGYTYIGYDKVNKRLIKIKEYAEPEGFPDYLMKKKKGTLPLEMKPRIHPQKREIWFRFWQMQQKLNLRTIPQIFDVFQEYNTVFAVMEYVEGISLLELKRKLGRNYTAAETLSFMRPLIWDMCQMHRVGMLHQSISESSIMMIADRTLKFYDFGAVSYPDPEPYGLAWGCPRESRENDVDRMAAVLFFCLSSAELTHAVDRPFDGFYWGECSDDVTTQLQGKIEHAMYFSREVGPCAMEELYRSLYG